MGVDQPQSLDPKAAAGSSGPARSRLHDKGLWIMAALAVLSVIAYFVAHDYHVHHGGVDCFPGCTFKQDLANYGSGVAFWLAVLLAIAIVVRWVLLSRRRRPREMT